MSVSKNNLDQAIAAAREALADAELNEHGAQVVFASALEDLLAVIDSAQQAQQPAALAVPDCGCCKGDGSMCPTVCRHAEENPPIFDRLPENEAEAEAMGEAP